ncbi:hypothetical protein PS854_03420 [Pseudomonas fluorescens]|uniref:Uncharacterized protein n=1 Tax=Pseudomonas fluorescens TaxID=294 RepID=A0A5E7LIC3_PSEFL|nr:hypothetical protein PS854_03420 [Pseudomonas fluorescens]
MGSKAPKYRHSAQDTDQCVSRAIQIFHSVTKALRRGPRPVSSERALLEIS